MLTDRFGADCLLQIVNHCGVFAVPGLLPTPGHFDDLGQVGCLYRLRLNGLAFEF